MKGLKIEGQFLIIEAALTQTIGFFPKILSRRPGKVLKLKFDIENQICMLKHLTMGDNLWHIYGILVGTWALKISNEILANLISVKAPVARF